MTNKIISTIELKNFFGFLSFQPIFAIDFIKMNKEIIVKESARMFYEAGFKTVTMDNVANQLAISKKTLYEVFGSKEQLISEVLEDEFEAIQNQFQQIQAQDLSAIEELMLLRKYIAQKFNGRQYQACTFQLQRYYGQLYRKIFIAQNHKIVEELAQNFQKGLMQNIYRKEVVPRVYAKLFLELQNSIKTGLELNKEVDAQYSFADIHSDIFIRGILSSKGLEKYKQLIQDK